MELTELGINKGKIKQLNNKGIESVEGLVRFLPRKYYDFTKTTDIKDIKEGDNVSVVVKIEDIASGPNYVRIRVIDRNNWTMNIIWFNQQYILNMLSVGLVYNFCGTATINPLYNNIQISNPVHFSTNLEKYKTIVPVYSKIKGMSADYLQNCIDTALNLVDKVEYLDKYLLDKYSLYKLEDTINNIHQPKTMNDVKMSERRILFDDLFYYATKLKLSKGESMGKTTINIDKADTIAPFIDSLPFTLTEDQLETTRSIYRDMKLKNRVNSLIQGDVGSGKTVVAFMLMLIASENKVQSALMCPTNVLAKQHFKEMKDIANKMNYNVEYLSGTTKAKEKNVILKGLKDGTIDMVIGTHAIISKTTEFKNLGLTIVDEEHRFGVVQRDLLNDKSSDMAHHITMSATPIPRSLALTLYGGSVKVYNITQMPNGRKKIITQLIDDRYLSYKFMKDEVSSGRQCYVVCPLIDDSDSDKMKDVKSVNEIFVDLKKYYKGSNIKVECISGDMKPDIVSGIVDKFTNKEIDILLSTTIIEVGVNVPNSTVMTVINAERFGLAQLHQLRGRVGRGAFQSYCNLVSNKDENPKLQALVDSTDGFKIAEKDLELRGAGDFLGTEQSGDNKYIMLMLSNRKYFDEIMKDVDDIFNNEARYNYYKNFIKECA